MEIPEDAFATRNHYRPVTLGKERRAGAFWKEQRPRYARSRFQLGIAVQGRKSTSRMADSRGEHVGSFFRVSQSVVYIWFLVGYYAFSQAAISTSWEQGQAGYYRETAHCDGG